MKDMLTNYGSLVTGAWPTTRAKNASGPSAVDGTPWTMDLINDLWGWQEAIMSLAGITPSGVSDTYTTSDIVNAIRRAGQQPGILVQTMQNAASLALCRFLPLTGQVLTIASYADLCASVYCGDGINATADCFYKTSDAGGTTRSTAGAYMVMADARGLVIRGLGGPNVKILASNGAGYYGGTATIRYLTDMLQGHRHPPLSTNFLAQGSGSYGIMGAGSTAANNATTGDPTADASDGTPRAGFETRGASVGAQICITY